MTCLTLSCCRVLVLLDAVVTIVLSGATFTLCIVSVTMKGTDAAQESFGP